MHWNTQQILLLYTCPAVIVQDVRLEPWESLGDQEHWYHLKLNCNTQTLQLIHTGHATEILIRLVVWSTFPTHLEITASTCISTIRLFGTPFQHTWRQLLLLASQQSGCLEHLSNTPGDNCFNLHLNNLVVWNTFPTHLEITASTCVSTIYLVVWNTFPTHLEITASTCISTIWLFGTPFQHPWRLLLQLADFYFS